MLPIRASSTTTRRIFDHAVVTCEPDADVVDDDLAWWLSRQEQAEIRAALATAGLM